LGIEYGPLTSSNLDKLLDEKWFIYNIDADDTWNWNTDPDPNSRIVRCETFFGNSSSQRNVGFRWDPLDLANLVWRFILHEMCASVVPSTYASGISMVTTTTGFRSKNPMKYEDDAHNLNTVLCSGKAMENEIIRYKFYLARTCETIGSYDLAIKSYLDVADKDAKVDNCHKYISLLGCARIYNYKNFLGYDPEKSFDYSEKAVELIPARPEAIGTIFNFYYNNGKHFLAAAVGYTHFKLYRPDNTGYMFYEKHGSKFFANLSYSLSTINAMDEFCEVVDTMEKCVDYDEELKTRMTPNVTMRNNHRAKKAAEAAKALEEAK